MIDSQGFRLNVGIILVNDDDRVFWARRVGQEAWQFPQGGIDRHEDADQAMYRELTEETGLRAEHVRVIGQTRDWLYYRLPSKYVRRRSRPVCIGQKQRWFLLRLTASEANVDLTRTPQPEFDTWRWVPYWQPPEEVIFFKRRVYRRALRELAPLLSVAPDATATAVRG